MRTMTPSLDRFETPSSMPKSFNLDRLNNINAEVAGQAALRVIDSLQTLTPEEQVVGATLAFAALIERFHVKHSQAFTVADNIKRRALAETPALRAVLSYVAGEL
jgi:hypothetical protein